MKEHARDQAAPARAPRDNGQEQETRVQLEPRDWFGLLGLADSLRALRAREVETSRRIEELHAQARKTRESRAHLEDERDALWLLVCEAYGLDPNTPPERYRWNPKDKTIALSQHG